MRSACPPGHGLSEFLQRRAGDRSEIRHPPDVVPARSVASVNTLFDKSLSGPPRSHARFRIISLGRSNTDRPFRRAISSQRRSHLFIYGFLIPSQGVLHRPDFFLGKLAAVESKEGLEICCSSRSDYYSVWWCYWGASSYPSYSVIRLGRGEKPLLNAKVDQ